MSNHPITIAQVRQDIRFNVNYGDPFRRDADFSELPALYNLADLFVQVYWLQDGEWHTRYGVLVDFEDSGDFGEAGYILEIPTIETVPKKIEEAQIETIKTYLEEMRAEWQKLLQHVRSGGSNEPMLYDQWIKVEKWLDSPEGRWDLLVAFHDNAMPGSLPLDNEERKAKGGKATPSKYLSFYDWLLKKQPQLVELQRANLSKIDEVTPALQRHWMPFLVDRKVSISVDWPLAYICFEHDYLVSSLDISYKTADYYYPFKNFLSNFDKQTDFTAPPPSSYERPVQLNPTFYTPFVYWMHLMRKIDLLKAQNQEALKEYTTYLACISTIRTVFSTYGPLRNASCEQLAELRAAAETEVSDYDGGISDYGWWKDEHMRQMSKAMTDLLDMERLFAAVIKKQNEVGVNSNRNVQIGADCRTLADSFLHARTKFWYEKLWNFNRDAFGYDLFLMKMQSLLAVSDEAERMYAFFRPILFESPILDDPQYNASSLPDTKEWAAMAYRSTSITCGLWSLYHAVRSKLMHLAAARSVPSPADVSRWFKMSTPNAAEGIGKWWLHDKGLRKLANFMLGGGKLAKLQGIEEEVLRSLDSIVGAETPSVGAMSKARLDQIREGVIQAKYRGLFNESGIDIQRPTRAKMPIHVVLNLYITTYTTRAAVASEWSTESKIAVSAAALGLASDTLGWVMYKKFGIEGALSSRMVGQVRSLGIKRAIGTMAGRVVLTGAVEGLVGGAGGLLGLALYGFSMYSNYEAGRNKDSILDGIAAIGIAVTMAGLLLDSTVVGVVPGILCNIVGVVIIVIAEVVRLFSLWTNEPEEYCKAFFTNALDGKPPGLGSLKKWREELGKIYWGSTPSTQDARALAERVFEFLADKDTFDGFAPKMA